MTKIGAWRDDKGGWILDRSPDFLRKSIENNLERLGLEKMTIVDLRMGSPETTSRVMRRMREERLLDHIGVSAIDAAQLRIARDHERSHMDCQKFKRLLKMAGGGQQRYPRPFARNGV